MSFNVNESITDQFRRIPNRGIGYGLLRYLNADTSIKARFESLPQPEIIFNYLGQIDQLFSDSSIFTLISNRCGPTRSPRAARRYLLEITAIITRGQLRVDWIYSENTHRRTTIKRVAADFTDSLHTLIANNREVRSLQRIADEDEDLYPLTSMQRGLLLHTLYSLGKGVYIEQLVCTLGGSLGWCRPCSILAACH